MSMIFDNGRDQTGENFKSAIGRKTPYGGLSAERELPPSNYFTYIYKGLLNNSNFVKKYPQPDKLSKHQEDKMSRYMDFRIEGNTSLNSDVFFTFTSIDALQNAATRSALFVETHRPKKNVHADAKSFRLNHRELFNANICISLTTIESLLLKQLVLSHRRVCSKAELITAIRRDPAKYTGLEMSLSRLQDKFINAYGERLFRSVRNKGYCLVQDVKSTH
ncbi:hypothetical protein PS914_04166 [Pseudomonas fluorescens]|uniref:winged helix-turn-helix domain-containing protein n=1 Tax=Pseudomonas fluorescens TaxID=294 RepID=UPI00124071E7|nr:winged helix-turn-helix domain-containing protein [Pseudomonas fluorescens]VVQ02034.1 hypothetical protein PS914_04166 [Pseudomonas fluorescens]